MKLACNYYRETEELVRDGVIDVDYFKFPGLGFQMEQLRDFAAFAERVTAIRPILLHGLYPAPHDLASATLRQDFDFDTVNALIEQSKTPGISLHPTVGAIDATCDTREVIATIADNVAFLKKHYGHMEFITVENMPDARFGDIIVPEVICEMTAAADCGFLLDVSHAFCAALYRGESFREYMQKLPLSRVHEIHLNGWYVQGSKTMCHTKINEEGYDALEWLLGECEPQIVTIEYGRDNDKLGVGIPLVSPDCVNERAKEEIAEQVQRVRKIMRQAI